jgi:hypothetical protein
MSSLSEITVLVVKWDFFDILMILFLVMHTIAFYFIALRD